MEPTKQDAQAMLADAGHARQAVHARMPKEHVPFYAWAAFLALIIPGFDIFDRAVWGWTTMAVALALFLATGLYYVLRSRDVRVADQAPPWTWAALTAAICVGGIVAEGLDNAIAFSYIIGGILSAVPLLICGQRLRRSS